MTKFFLFHKEEVGDSSTTASDTGVGVSISAIPASSVSYISSVKGSVEIIFNNTGVYDFLNTVENEGVKKTQVSIECEPGDEAQLINDILNFIGKSSDTVMRFDFVSSIVGFRKASLTTTKSLNISVKNAPESINKKTVVVSSTGLTALTLDGIEFTDSTYPIVDYNSESLVSECVTGLTGAYGWDNASQLGGTAYNCSTVPIIYAPFIMPTYGKNVSGLSTPSIVKAPNLAFCEFTPYSATGASAVSIDDYLGPGDSVNDTRGFELDNELIISGDYTSYFVIGVPIGRTPDLFGVMYSGVKSAGPFSNSNPNSISVAYENTDYAFTSKECNTEDLKSVSYSFPDLYDDENRQTCYVFVVRRDSNNNIIAHNHEGDIVCVIPSKTDGVYGRTDGDLSVKYLLLDYVGSASGEATAGRSISDATYEFIARIGFIQRDIGASESSRLAKALYDRYKP